nr:glutamine synthetase III [Maliibacterium massiliense]
MDLEHFGEYVFDDAVMRTRISAHAYEEFHRVIDEGIPMDIDLADEVAHAMCAWAVEKGATHYTHWFQPLTGFTAEKHDAFLSPSPEGPICEFSGRELIRGESDASSFPSGGLRATFEARGYTAWDCTSPAFVKKDVSGVTALCIPTAFCSYTGEALDNKTPLLRSVEALRRQAGRVLRALGRGDVGHVNVSVGAEQEYFLVRKDLYAKRKDLIYTGRTLFGARPPKGQELSDQYYGVIRPVVSEFMAELNEELWKLGVYAKTQHNEGAPAQHELAPVYSQVNSAADHNQLIMEMMRKVADRHNLVCLLHEKPFEGVNGSGKHNNWSLCTDTGENLLKPGKDPAGNITFLVFFMAVIAAVDEYAPLLRMACAGAGNDQRLGGHEAPPPIISIFLGEPLTEMLESIAGGENAVAQYRKQVMSIGVSTMPLLHRDNTDRNRTSPFAFTGNKFEFRMVGAPAAIATPNIVINTIVAEYLARAADALEGAPNMREAAYALVRSWVNAHRRIIFNGNNYTEEWVQEAKKRGLPILPSSVEAIEQLEQPEMQQVFARHQVFTQVELHSRAEIMRQNYIKTIKIEAYTMLEMARKQILPCGMTMIDRLADTVCKMKATGMRLDDSAQREHLEALVGVVRSVKSSIDHLQHVMEGVAPYKEDTRRLARYYQQQVLQAMAQLRSVCDKLEVLTARELWPIPTYGELLYYV